MSIPSISAGVENLPCFPTFYDSDPYIIKIPNFPSTYLFTNNIIMTNEPMHTASKGRTMLGMALN